MPTARKVLVLRSALAWRGGQLVTALVRWPALEHPSPTESQNERPLMSAALAIVPGVRRSARPDTSVSGLIGCSLALRRLLQEAEVVAQTDATVLIHGE